MNVARGTLAYSWVLFVGLLLAGCGSLEPRTPAAGAPVQQVSWKTIGHDVVIIGKLGLPLGVATEIEATVVSGRLAEPAAKSLQFTYLLQVDKVGDTELSTPQLEFFTLLDSELPLANNPFALYELKEGKKTGSLTGQQEEEIEKDYLGKRYRLLVFEDGRYPGGNPETFIQAMAEPGMLRTDPRPRFRPMLNVVRVIPNVWPQPGTDLFKTLHEQCAQVSARIGFSAADVESASREAAKRHRRMVSSLRMRDDTTIELGLAGDSEAKHGIVVLSKKSAGHLMFEEEPELEW